MSKSKNSSQKTAPLTPPARGAREDADSIPAEPPVGIGPWYRLGSWAEPGPFPVIILLGVLALATYSNSFNCGFVLDNSVIIPKDTRLRVVSWEWEHLWNNNLKPIFTENYWYPYLESDLYRPLTTLSYLINYSVLADPTKEPSPVGYHVVNLLLHWVNAAMFFWLVRNTVKNTWASIFVAALFVVHPLNVESVTNMVGRADQLATFCVLAGLNLHIAAYRRSGLTRALCLVGLMLVAFCGMLCKESAVVLVATMPLYDLCFPPAGKAWSWQVVWDRFVRVGWAHYICLIPAVMALLGVRYYIYLYSPVFDQIGVDNPIVFAKDFWTGRMTAIRVIGYYLYLLVWPEKLSCDYSYNELPVYGSWHKDLALFPGTSVPLEAIYAWLSLLMVIGILAIWVWSFFRSRALFFYLGFAIVAFLPTSNLLIIIGQEIGERFMYLTLIGVFGALAVVLAKVTRPLLAGRWGLSPDPARVVLASCAVFIVATLGVRSFVRNYDWFDEVELWTSAREVCPNSFKVHKGLALAMAQRDNSLETLNKAIPIAEQGLAVLDDHKGSDEKLPLVHLPSQLFLDLGRYYVLKAELMARNAGIQDTKQNPPSREALERALYILNRAANMDKAVNQASRESRIKRGAKPEDIFDVGNFEVYKELGVIHAKLGHYDAALNDALSLRRLRPNDPISYLQSAYLYRQIGKLEDAAVELLKAMIVGDLSPHNWDGINELYGRLTPRTTPVIVDPRTGQRSLNKDNPLLSRNLVRATQELVQTMIDTKRYNLAQIFRNKAIQDFNMPPAMFTPMFKRAGLE